MKVDQIKETVFWLWPTEPRENEKEAWDRCVVPIDEMDQVFEESKEQQLVHTVHGLW